MKGEVRGKVRSATWAFLQLARKGTIAELAAYVASPQFQDVFNGTAPSMRMALFTAAHRAMDDITARMPAPKPGTRKVNWEDTDLPERYRKAWDRYGGDIQSIASALRMTPGAVKRARSRHLKPEQWRKVA